MGNFDNTVDSRWRPDFESSRRRVLEEERDAAVPFSRELSFVPSRGKSFEPHDAQTVALIRRVKGLEQLPHGARVGELLEEWNWIDKMQTPEEKQRFIEPFIEAVRRNPRANEAQVIFLMLVFEPVRRSVSKAFLAAHAGLSPQPRDVNWSNREEARMVRFVEREQLYDVTRSRGGLPVPGAPAQGPFSVAPGDDRPPSARQACWRAARGRSRRARPCAG
jgi:hypothetical protein